ncbi:hypothetical protein CR513_31608, partial [Mucuna pruriens]
MDNEMLMVRFEENEIEEANLSCESSKSPGEFQENGKIVRRVNSSFVYLVTKKENSNRIEEYRPIYFIDRPHL